MTRAGRQRLSLLLAVAALLALAGWQWRRDRAARPGTLLDLAPAAVSRIELQFGRGVAMRYVRRHGHWQHLGSAGPPADDARLDALAAIAAAPVDQWRAAASLDPAKIGLAPPRAILRLDGHTLRFGAPAALGQRCYVQRGTRVALVSLRYMPQAAPARSVALP